MRNEGLQGELKTTVAACGTDVGAPVAIDSLMFILENEGKKAVGPSNLR